MKSLQFGFLTNCFRGGLISASIFCALLLALSLGKTFALRAVAASFSEQRGATGEMAAIDAGDLASLSPEQALDRAIEACRSLNSYQCRLALHLTKDDVVQNSQYVFSYKKPKLVRMRVEDGKDKGSTVILRADGRIRGRREGFLSMFAVTLKPDDRRLYDLWNRSFSESDWVTLLAETRERLQIVNVSRIELIDGGRLIFLHAEGEDFVEETWLDARRLVLLRKRARHGNGDSLDATWSDIALNPAFDKNFFSF